MFHNHPNPPNDKSAANGYSGNCFRYIRNPADKVFAVIVSVRPSRVVANRDGPTFKCLEETRAFMIHKRAVVELTASIFPYKQIAGELIRTGTRDGLREILSKRLERDNSGVGLNPLVAPAQSLPKLDQHDDPNFATSLCAFAVTRLPTSDSTAQSSCSLVPSVPRSLFFRHAPLLIARDASAFQL
jgi:hypothetical protein